MLNPDSTQGPGLPVQKSDSQAPAPAPATPPAKPRLWYEYDPPAETAAVTPQGPDLLAPVLVPKETEVVLLPEKRRLCWSWDFTLMIDEGKWPPNKGRRFMDFHNHPGNVTAFLRRCDSCFDFDIPNYIEGHVRRCILEAMAKVPAPGESPKTEVEVKLTYAIKVWTPGERANEWKGTKEYAIKLDRQVRGHLMAVKYSFEQGVFRFARAHFRRLAAGWIQSLPPSAARENALRQIKHELYEIVGPDMVAEDELPRAIEDIEIATPGDVDETKYSRQP